MKSVLVFLAAAAAVGVVDALLTPGLRARFNIGLTELFGINLGKSSFYELPESETEAKAANWSIETPASSYLADKLTMYCYIDKVLCVYFDDTGYPAGMQFSILKSNFTKNQLDFEPRGYTNWTVSVNGISQDLWSIAQYFIDEECLQISKEDRLANRNSSNLLQCGYLWLTGFNGTIYKIPTSTTNITATTLFKEQRCVPWMGLHFHYNMTQSLECVAEQIFPWFLLTDSGNLIGTGLASFGEMTVGDGHRNWFETSPTLGVKYIVKTAPECLYDMVSDVGIVATHFYYVSNPRHIGC